MQQSIGESKKSNNKSPKNNAAKRTGRLFEVDDYTNEVNPFIYDQLKPVDFKKMSDIEISSV